MLTKRTRRAREGGTLPPMVTGARMGELVASDIPYE